jgi:ATP-dependent Lon protease
VAITGEALRTVAREYTREAGVRNLEREIATVFRKVATEIATEKAKAVKVTAAQLHRFLGPPRYRFGLAEKSDEVGIATGLIYSEMGGDVISVEATLMHGEGKLSLTGQLGDVLKESGQAALSYVRSRSRRLGVDEDWYQKYDVHIHIPAGAVPKDGPSAGITLATALASAVTGQPVRKDVAMTGEITLRGKVLPIGGVKEKVLAAHRAGVKTVLVPKDNEKDLEEIPEHVRRKLRFVLVEQMDQVLAEALLPTQTPASQGLILPPPGVEPAPRPPQPQPSQHMLS